MPIITVKLGDSTVARHSLSQDTFSVGRSRDNDVVIETLSVSRRHLEVQREGDSYILTDLGSANGTFVDGIKLSGRTLRNGDTIEVGATVLKFGQS